MSNLVQVKQKLTNLSTGQLEILIADELQKIANEAIGLNQKQLENGLFPSGMQTPEYSPLSLKLKTEKGTMFGNGTNWSLHDSGDLYSKMKLEKTLFGARIYSESAHVAPLSRRASKRGVSVDDFFGLSDENRDSFMEKLHTNVSNSIKNYVYGM